MNPIQWLALAAAIAAARLIAAKMKPFADFAPMAQVANFQFALSVNATHPAKSMPELVAWYKANPAKATFIESAMAIVQGTARWSPVVKASGFRAD